MKFISILLSALLFSWSHFTSAQSEEQLLEDDRYEKWYQIELVVFERIQSSTSEIWPRNVRLQYPRTVKHLFTSEQWEEFTRSEDLLDSEPETTPDDSLNDPSVSEMETPRILLDRENYLLKTEAQKLRNRSAYRVLFHEAWREPLSTTDTTEAIPIYGGDLFGNHYELEGWVKISLNRFLHIETDLWKVGYELNYGQELDYWPPAPKFPMPGVPDEQAVTVNATGLNYSQFGVNEEPTLRIDTESLSTQLSLSSYDSIEKSPYVINNIITMKQKRRMRSEELHYIDHPKLGVLVMVVPYKVYLPTEEETPPAPGSGQVEGLIQQ